MKKLLASFFATLILLSPAWLSASGEETAPNAHRWDNNWRLQVGLTYMNGCYDLFDAYEDNGYDVRWEDPFGLTFIVGQDFSNGLGWDVCIGPAFVAYIDDDDDGDDHGHHHDDEYDDMDFLLPIGVDLRYTFAPKSDFSPYLRAGVCYLCGDGRDFDSNGVGFECAAGVEFLRNRLMTVGGEVGYNSVSVDFNGRDVKPYGLTISVFTSF